MREQNNITDGIDIGQKHSGAVNTNPHPAGRRHTVFQGLYIIDIHLVRFLVAQIFSFNCFSKRSR